MANTNQVIISTKELSAAYYGKTPINEIYVGKTQVFPKVILDLWVVPTELVFDYSGGTKTFEVNCGLPDDWTII